MSRSLSYFGLAEGVANDMRGTATIVGFGLRALAGVDLPFRGSVTMIAQIDSELGDDSESIVILKPLITAPDGSALVAGQQQTAIGSGNQLPGMSPRFYVYVTVEVNFLRNGRYDMQLGIEFSSDEELVGRASLDVFDPNQQP